MAGKNPFKIIEEENIRHYKEKGFNKPSFINAIDNSSVINNNPSSGSPSFPSFS